MLLNESDLHQHKHGSGLFDKTVLFAGVLWHFLRALFSLHCEENKLKCRNSRLQTKEKYSCHPRSSPCRMEKPSEHVAAGWRAGPSPTCLSACRTPQHGDLSLGSLYVQDRQGSEHPQKCVGFWGGWCIHVLLPGGTNAFQCSSLVQTGGGRDGKGERALRRGLLLLAICSMPVVTNAVVFRLNIQCRIETPEDKNLIFKTIAEAVTFQRGLCTAEETALGQPGYPPGLRAGGPR